MTCRTEPTGDYGKQTWPSSPKYGCNDGRSDRLFLKRSTHMTVEELVKKLKAFDPKMTVVGQTGEEQVAFEFVGVEEGACQENGRGGLTVLDDYSANVKDPSVVKTVVVGLRARL
jgi:hypothetical protein